MLKQAMAAISGSLDKISLSLIEIIKYYMINIKSIKYIQYRNGIDPLKDSFITCKTIARVNGFFFPPNLKAVLDALICRVDLGPMCKESAAFYPDVFL